MLAASLLCDASSMIAFGRKQNHTRSAPHTARMANGAVQRAAAFTKRMGSRADLHLMLECRKRRPDGCVTKLDARGRVLVENTSKRSKHSWCCVRVADDRTYTVQLHKYLQPKHQLYIGIRCKSRQRKTSQHGSTTLFVASRVGGIARRVHHSSRRYATRDASLHSLQRRASFTMVLQS
jgi:hypothetical protein